ncbi:hypothetical protein ACLOJK_011804 [Asimina triloba]
MKDAVSRSIIVALPPISSATVNPALSSPSRCLGASRLLCPATVNPTLPLVSSVIVNPALLSPLHCQQDRPISLPIGKILSSGHRRLLCAADRTNLSPCLPIRSDRCRLRSSSLFFAKSGRHAFSLRTFQIIGYDRAGSSITLLHRMGIRIAISMLSIVVVGLVEEKRRSSSIIHGRPILVLWLALMGVVEAFNVVLHGSIAFGIFSYVHSSLYV